MTHAGADELTYLAPTRVNLQLTMERWPEVAFRHPRAAVAYPELKRPAVVRLYSNFSRLGV
mgnify:CR=1 FL=1